MGYISSNSLLADYLNDNNRILISVQILVWVSMRKLFASKYMFLNKEKLLIDSHTTI